MAAEIPTIEPTEHQAGDSLLFNKTLADYPASLWTLTYKLVSRENAPAITITATADGDDFEIEVAAATTAAWDAGKYLMVGYVSDATDRFTVYRGEITITADVSESDHIDGRTYWERVRDKLQVVVETGVIREVIRYTVNGVSTEVQTMKDALDALAYAESKVKQEKNGNKPQRVYTKFVSAR